jgi:hypothetical protein
MEKATLSTGLVAIGTPILLKANARVIKESVMVLDALIVFKEFLKLSMLLVYTNLWIRMSKIRTQRALVPAPSLQTPLLTAISNVMTITQRQPLKKLSSHHGKPLSMVVALSSNLKATINNLPHFRNKALKTLKLPFKLSKTLHPRESLN